MSSSRSRSGGSVRGMTLILKNRSSLKRPCRTRSPRLALVEAMTRASNGTGSEPPSGSKDPFARARLRAAWVRRVRVSMPSRKSVPPPAWTIFPFFLGRVGAVALEAPEELRVDQGFGEGGAVDFHEPAIPPRAALMNEAGGQLLARSVFAGDEDPAVRRGRRPDLGPEVLKGGAFADQAIASGQTLAQADVLLLQPGPEEGVADGQHDFFQGQRLFEEIEGAHLDGFDRRFHGPVAGDDHHRRTVLVALDLGQHVEAVHLGQPDIENDQAEAFLGQGRQSLLSGGGGPDGIPFILQDSPERGPDGRLVVDDQNAFLTHAGNSIVNFAPSAGCFRRG